MENTEKICESNRDYKYIDIWKFLMSLIVVAIHTRPLEGISNVGIHIIFDRISSMAVPFFFMATGYLLFEKMNYKLSVENIDVLKNYLLKILKIYLIWTIVYMPLAIYDCFVENGCFTVSYLKYYIKCIILVGGAYNSWHLWYLLSAIYTIIIMIVLIKLKMSHRSMFLLFIVLAVLGLCIDWVSIYSVESVVLKFIQKIVKHTIQNGRLVTGMVYIPLGMSTRFNMLKKRWNLVVLIVGLLLSYHIQNIIVCSVILIPVMFSFWKLIEKTSNNGGGLCRYFRGISIYIYLIHMYIFTFYYSIVFGKKTYGFDCFVVTVIVSIFISFLFYTVKNIFRKSTAKY